MLSRDVGRQGFGFIAIHLFLILTLCFIIKWTNFKPKKIHKNCLETFSTEILIIPPYKVLRLRACKTNKGSCLSVDIDVLCNSKGVCGFCRITIILYIHTYINWLVCNIIGLKLIHSVPSDFILSLFLSRSLNECHFTWRQWRQLDKTLRILIILLHMPKESTHKKGTQKIKKKKKKQKKFMHNY